MVGLVALKRHDGRVRKRAIWIVGVLVLVLAIGFAALLALPPTPPYKFLTGRSAMWRKASPDVPGQYIALYAFPADYAKLSASAERELIAKGFVGVMVSWSGHKERGAMFVPPEFLSGGGTRDPKPFSKVTLVPNTMIASNTRLGPFDLQPRPTNRRVGWVTVIVEDSKEPTMLEKIRAFVGF